MIFGLGRLCAEDFLEILLLAGNGYGVAALKLLRGLYERAVTIAYLSEHPEEATVFLDYHFVSQHKVLTELKAIGLEERFPRDEREKVEAEYQRVKDNYLVTGCKECGAKRMNYTWSKLDVVAMAKSTGLGKLLAMAYYLPLRHAHSTVAALLARIEQSSSGGMAFNPGAQPKEADIALGVAHDLILKVLEIQEQYFELGELHEDLQKAMRAFVDIWSKDKKENRAG